MEPEIQSGDDSVDHIQDPRPLGEKEDLLEEGEKKVQSNAGSVIAGDHDICSGELTVGTTEMLELPVEFGNNVMVLTCESTHEAGSCKVFLVGTSHVSQESCQKVEAIIRSLKPQVVFVELCANRSSILEPQTFIEELSMNEMIDMWKNNQNLFEIAYGWLLTKISRQLEVFPGDEFRVAFEEANKYGGKVILGDRPIQITLQRTWGKMPLRHQIQLVYRLVRQAIFLPKTDELNNALRDLNNQEDMLTLTIEELSEQFPTLMDTLVNERDKFMAYKLLTVASEHSSVVAVVGNGHLKGIKKNWNQPINIEELLELPTKESYFTLKNSFLVVLVAVTAIVTGFYLSRKV